METIRRHIRTEVVQHLRLSKPQELSGSSSGSLSAGEHRAYFDSIGQKSRDFTQRAARRAAVWSEGHWAKTPPLVMPVSSTPEDGSQPELRHISKFHANIEHMSPETPQAKMSQELALPVGSILLGKSHEQINTAQKSELARALVRTFTGPLASEVSDASKILFDHNANKASFGHIFSSRRVYKEMDQDHEDYDKMVTQVTYRIVPLAEQHHPIDASWRTKPALVLRGVTEGDEHKVTLTPSGADAEPQFFTFT